MRKAAAVLCLLLALTVAVGLQADTLQLRSDSVLAMVLEGQPLCEFEEGSRFEWEKGELRPL